MISDGMPRLRDELRAHLRHKREEVINAGFADDEQNNSTGGRFIMTITEPAKMESRPMNGGEVRLVRDGELATILFDRPQARNAMTWQMYEGLAAACAQLSSDADVRVVVLRGVGGKAFIAGTDIAQFQEFTTAEQGVDYEATMERYLTALEALPMPTLAVVEGWAIGGGLAIAACCDLRMATPGTKFGVPIARTLGNCLSVANYARLIATLGLPRAKRMLLMAENLSAEDALASGFLVAVVDPAALDQRVAETCEQLKRNAPVTLRVTKEAMRRLQLVGLPDDEDLLRACYGSEDFRAGVKAFLERRAPQWSGR